MQLGSINWKPSKPIRTPHRAHHYWLTVSCISLDNAPPPLTDGSMQPNLYKTNSDSLVHFVDFLKPEQLVHPDRPALRSSDADHILNLIWSWSRVWQDLIKLFLHIKTRSRSKEKAFQLWWLKLPFSLVKMQINYNIITACYTSKRSTAEQDT